MKEELLKTNKKHCNALKILFELKCPNVITVVLLSCKKKKALKITVIIKALKAKIFLLQFKPATPDG